MFHNFSDVQPVWHGTLPPIKNVMNHMLCMILALTFFQGVPLLKKGWPPLHYLIKNR
jgi:hypothetical protein